jgi:hypothetical protein
MSPTGHTDSNDSIRRTVSALTRSSSWTLVDSTALQFDAHHPQGLVRVNDMWWITTVDTDNQQGYLFAVDNNGNAVDRFHVGDSVRYHPGGFDFDGSAFWVASAEYRPQSSTLIERVTVDGAIEPIFTVDNHIGAVARLGPDGDLVGWTWGSRQFIRWTTDGTEVATADNPHFFIDHQDLQWIGGGLLLCAGVALLQLKHGAGYVGGIGLLDSDTLTVRREIPFPHYSPNATRRVETQNPICAAITNSSLVIHLLPDDHRGTIRSYATPLTTTI